MVKVDIVFVTSNKDKVREAKMILKNSGIRLKVVPEELDEIQSLDVKVVASYKARRAYEMTKMRIIVEDTGFFVECWNGFPGALAKHMQKAIGNDGITSMVSKSNRRAYSETSVAYCDGHTTKVFSGRIEGSISDKARGAEGFGWDFIFIPKGEKRTFAELGIAEKNKISARGIAFRKLRDYLTK